MRRGRITIPPRQKACIHAAKDMLGAIAGAGTRASVRLAKVKERYGICSDEYLAEQGGYEETQRLLGSLHPLLLERVHNLEAPFKPETW